jgi:hypothetical protein
LPEPPNVRAIGAMRSEAGDPQGAVPSTEATCFALLACRPMKMLRRPRIEARRVAWLLARWSENSTGNTMNFRTLAIACALVGAASFAGAAEVADAAASAASAVKHAAKATGHAVAKGASAVATGTEHVASEAATGTAHAAHKAASGVKHAAHKAASAASEAVTK